VPLPPRERPSGRAEGLRIRPRRRLRTVVIWLAVIPLVVGVLASCGSSQPGSSQPTTRATGGSTHQARSSPKTQCTTRTVHLVRTSWGGATGHVVADLRLRNLGTRSCVLSRLYPSIVGSSGRTLVRGKRHPPPLGPHRIVLAPGRTAMATVEWGNWCRDVKGPLRERIALGGQRGSFDVTPAAPPPCSGNHAPSVIAVVRVTILHAS
jgi:hypothetical protein